jgi:hypothetical protein
MKFFFANIYFYCEMIIAGICVFIVIFSSTVIIAQDPILYK